MIPVSADFYPVDGSTPVALGTLPYIINSVNGLAGRPQGLGRTKTPGQIGETGIDYDVAGRLVSMGITIVADSVEEMWTNRANLSRATAARPKKIGETGTAKLGTLVIHRPGLPDLQIMVAPASPQDDIGQGGGYSDYDCQFYAPDPEWQDVVETLTDFQETGGFTFPFDLPEAFGSFNQENEVFNPGTEDAPVKVTFYAQTSGGTNMLNPRIDNLTTGSFIFVNRSMANGSRIEIDTNYGAKRVDYITSAEVVTNDLPNLGAGSDIQLSLIPGANLIKFSAATNPGGRMALTTRWRYAGI